MVKRLGRCASGIGAALVVISLGCSQQTRSSQDQVDNKNNGKVVESSAAKPDRPHRYRQTGKASDLLPNTLLYTHENKPVRFYDDLVKDHAVFIVFMYTTCDGI